jgi:hypothetical protein
MMAFGWLRSRAQIAAAAFVIALVAVFAALTGPDLARLYRSEVAGCAGRGNCQAAMAAFATQDGSLRLWLGVLVVTVPAIIGMFWGAPLVASELEDGTFRLAWTQSVTRTRWLAVRLVIAGLASMAAAGLLSLLVTWWASPLDRAGLSQFATFDQRDIVPVGYAAFAFALGVAAGAAIRRTLPAMAVTLVAFVAARMAVTYWLRPRLLSPVVLARPIDLAGYGSAGFLPIAYASPHLQFQPPDLPNGWVTSIDLVDKSGRGLPTGALARLCPGIGGSSGRARVPLSALGGPASGGHTQRAPASAVNGLQECGTRLSAQYHEAVSYQPASHYWPLQWYELAIFLAAALVLSALAIWRVRHAS